MPSTPSGNMQKPITVIYFTHYAKLYGANRSLIDLILGIKNINPQFRPVVILPETGAFTEMLDSNSVQYMVIPFYKCITDVSANTFVAGIKGIFKLLINFFLSIKFYKRIKAVKPDIFHTNTSVITWGIWLSLLLKRPHVQHVREFGKQDYNFIYEFGPAWYNWWLNKSAAVIAISKTIYKNRLEKSTASVKKIIYNGIVFSDELEKRRSARSVFLKNTGRYTFGILGNISKEKGQLVAIEALYVFNKKHNNNAGLIIAGTGENDYLAELKKKVQEYGLAGNVSFPGFVNDLASLYSNIDSLLMCSAHEAFGRVTAEAMSYGVPVIGYNNAGTTELIVDGYNGLLYQTDNDLIDAMLRLTGDKDVSERMVMHAFETIKENFTTERYAKSVYELYTGLI